MKGSWKDNNTLTKINERRRRTPALAKGYFSFEDMDDAQKVMGYLETVQDKLGFEFKSGFEMTALSPYDVIVEFESVDIRKDEEEFLNMIEMATGCWPDDYSFTYVDEE